MVVTHDPGPWFEEALGALADQDYPNLSILVIDAASSEDPTPRIAAVAPRAFVRRLDTNPGFSAAFNTALGMVQGAAFFLGCHDDVALAPGAVRLLVEEAYRSNAGIVGPKFVHWDQPNALLAVGLGADRFGAPASLCERGELDQEQHDAVRDVFAVPSAAFLIRTDLAKALDGFDPAIDFHGEDIDLCWRAHLAGARVLVAPSAVGRHIEALGDRRGDDRHRLQTRYRLRMLATNYGWFYTLGEGLQQLVLSVAEIVVALATGRAGRAGDIVRGYVWNARRLGNILAKRRANRKRRQLTDLEIRRLQVRGSARVSSFVRGQVGAHAEGGPETLADAGRQWLFSVRRGLRKENLVAAFLVAVVVALGSRQLLRDVPAVGEFARFEDRARDLLGEWWTGWRSSGLGAAGFAPTGLGIFGVAGFVALGGTGVVRQLLILAPLPLGLVGAWRLGGFSPHSRAKAAALVAYAANPLPYNALAGGSLRGLVMYGASPWLLSGLARAVDDDQPRPARRASLAKTCGLGLVLAAVMTVYPGALVLFGLMALAVGLAVPLADGRRGLRSGRGLLRLVVATVGGAVVAALLHVPWLTSLLASGDPDLTFGGRGGWSGSSVGAAAHDLGALVHFDTGGANNSMLTWGLLVAALLGLAIGRERRLAWATRGWLAFLLPLGLVGLIQAADLSIGLPPPEVLLAPAAAGLAAAVGASMAAFDTDLGVYRFGWRQPATVVAAAGLALATIPLLAGAFDGRWQMPRSGYDRTFGFLADEDLERGPFRVLWLGSGTDLPAGGWQLDGDVAFATTIRFPGASGLWTGPRDDAVDTIPAVLERARLGDSRRLGRELSVMSVRYVVVVGQLAPAPWTGPDQPLPAWLTTSLESQLDLAQLDLNGALTVFRNPAWLPFVGSVPANAAQPSDLLTGAGAGGSATTALEPAAPALGSLDQHGREFAGDVSGGAVVHVAQAADDGWRFAVDGTALTAMESFGWAQRYEPSQSGMATLSYQTGAGHHLISLLGLALWPIVAFVALRWHRSVRGLPMSVEATPAPVEPLASTGLANQPAPDDPGPDEGDGGDPGPEIDGPEIDAPQADALVTDALVTDALEADDRAGPEGAA